MWEMWMLAKIFIVFILIIPAMLLACLVWIFGGWVKGWDEMPNPVYALLDIIES